MKMIKKIVSIITITCLSITMILPAFANNTTNVSFIKDVGFIVTIPDEVSIIYDGVSNNYSGDDIISIDGAVKANEIVSVSTDSNITLYDGIGGTYVANANIGGDLERDFSSTEICNGSSEGFNISVPDNKMPSGTWTGLMYFDINCFTTDDLQLSANKLYLGSGSNYQLEVTSTGVSETNLGSLFNIDANATDLYDWSSSDSDVVSVTDTGYISVKYAANSGDIATITASNGIESASCEVNVTGITFNNGESELSISMNPDSYYQIEANVLPAEAGGLVTYSSSKNGINVNNDGLIYVDPSVPNGTVAYIAVSIGNINRMITLTVGPPAAHIHTWNVVSTTPPTCTTNGIINYSCSCGETKSETILATGHNYVNTVIAPTCTTAGYTKHTCSICGNTYNDTYVDMLQHQYVSVVTRPATYSTTGVRTYTCTLCGDSYTEIIPQLIQTVVSGTIVNETINGSNWYGVVLPDGTVSVTSVESSDINTKLIVYSGDIIIPDEVSGIVVSSISDYAFYNQNLITSVTMSDNITNIGIAAFSGCSSLKSINVSNSVTTLKTGTFSNCIALTSITIPDSVTVFGSNVFSGCTTLKTVVLPSSMTDFGISTFQNCKALTSIVIPNGITLIGNGTFNGCIKLTSVILPNTLIRIGDSAFNGCTTLASITIPTSVTTINSYAFQGCTALTSIIIPTNVKIIYNYAFSGWTSSKIIRMRAVNSTGMSLATYWKGSATVVWGYTGS